MEKNNNALFFVCSLVEYIARKTTNRRDEVVKRLADDVGRIYDYADVFHCEPIEKVADDFIQKDAITNGTYDNLSDCKYTIPGWLTKF